MLENALFIDWLTISQAHSEPQPALFGGETVYFDQQGNERHSRLHFARFAGSYETSVALQSNGNRVLASGNFGRYSRQDNLFNHDFEGTIRCINRLVMAQGLHPFDAGQRLSDDGGSVIWTGASLRRMDITCNYAAGSLSAAREYIRWLSRQSRHRIKKGNAGDESVWWANSREMLKAYIKPLEMQQHGDTSSRAYEWAMDNGIVRVELELKKRTLHDLGLYWMGDVTMKKIVDIFKDRTEVTRRNDRSSDSDILEQIPQRHRAVAAAWLAGNDVKTICSRATYFRHRKALEDFGLDISEPRPMHALPVQVRVLELQPMAMPSWYDLRAA